MQVRVPVQVTSVGVGKLRYRYWASIHPWRSAQSGRPRIEVPKYLLNDVRTACLGVWGRGRGGRREESTEKEDRGWSLESRGVKPMGRRGPGLCCAVVHATRQRKTETPRRGV